MAKMYGNNGTLYGDIYKNLKTAFTRCSFATWKYCCLKANEFYAASLFNTTVQELIMNC